MEQIEIKETDYCKLNVHYEADAEQIEQKRIEVLAIFKKAPVPGNRPGKASLESIKVYYRKQIDDALKRALAEDAFHNTLFEKSIKPYGTPQFSSMVLSNNKFSCDFSMHKMPDFELKPYKTMEMPKPTVDYTVEQLSALLMEELRKKHGETVPYGAEDVIQTGDNVILDFQAFDGDTKLEALSGQGQLTTIGNSQIPEFNTELLGMKIDEARSFTINRADHPSLPMASETARFEVKLVMGAKINPMPLNDELAKKLGKENFDQLQSEVMSMADSRVQMLKKQAENDQISNRLVADNVFTIPSWLGLAEAKLMAAQAKMKWEDFNDETKARYLEAAEKNVRLSLVLEKIRDGEPEIQMNDQEVLDIIKANLKDHGNPDELLTQMSKSGYLPVLAAKIRDEMALDFIHKTCTFIE